MNENSTADYGWVNGDAPHTCDYLAPEVMRTLRELKAARVMDLGAGNGKLCGLLSGAGFDVVGVEYDRQGIAIARRSHPHVSFHCYSVEEDPDLLLRDEKPFDVVVSTEVIEHLYAPHRLAEYASTVLKSGGHLIVTTPYHGYLKNLALSLAGRWDRHHTALWKGGHIKFFSRSTLTSLLHEHGFEVTEFTGIGRVPWLWKSMLLVARKRSR